MNIHDTARVFDLEQVPEGEEQAIKEVIELELQILQKSIGQKRPVPRAQHPKHHGCVRAEFTVANELPAEFQFGVFAEAGQTFPALIRFSNARKQDDRESGGHGMAIKLMDVQGEKLLPSQRNGQTQDFLLLDSPIFCIKDAIQFAEFDGDLLNSKVSLLGKLSFLDYFVKHPREAWILHQIESNQSSNPLDTQYWSVTPYKLGAGAVKYLVKPQLNGLPVVAPEPSVDQLRTAMKLHLETREAHFDFYVQPQVDPADQPIEDATHLWQSPVHKVATIRIPCQSFDSNEQMEFCENLSFSPWHALTEHRPLGGLNRLRKATYLALSDFRHEQNKKPSVEPTPEMMRPESKPTA